MKKHKSFLETRLVIFRVAFSILFLALLALAAAAAYHTHWFLPILLVAFAADSTGVFLPVEALLE